MTIEQEMVRNFLQNDNQERIRTALQKAREQREPAVAKDHAAPASAVPQAKSDIWEKIPSIDPIAALGKNRLVSLGPSAPALAAFDILRTNVLHQLRQNKWTSVAITSPTAACGKTTVALNLAFSLARQKDCRTVLFDFDLRRPSIASALRQKNPPRIVDFIRGQHGIEDAFLRYGDNLAIASNSRPERLSAELLQSPEMPKTLKAVKQALAPDVMVFDLPPMLSNDDVMAFLPNVDCVILVAAAEATTLAEVDLCENELASQGHVLGVVLNKCRYMPDEYGY